MFTLDEEEDEDYGESFKYKPMPKRNKKGFIPMKEHSESSDEDFMPEMNMSGVSPKNDRYEDSGIVYQMVSKEGEEEEDEDDEDDAQEE
eukprot:CAMPEP_0170550012 /NCGR_PEP_ID=MMETSP0211-20121228/8065_1 /TAXON_ID=311385 /ORGANISM="Pseudokeronopsis sp., Strain OXSARD2" /LENGTH=88 /DNA_ID=CAMNT_0010856275 /DNA_START=506 /DNA_END=772 /DNA_ORIENTATION=+